MEQVIGYEVARACHSIATTTFQMHNGTKHIIHKISKKQEFNALLIISNLILFHILEAQANQSKIDFKYLQ